MMRTIVAFLAVVGLTGMALALECWLDRNRVSDRAQNVFLGVVGFGIACLMVVLLFHFGRFA